MAVSVAEVAARGSLDRDLIAGRFLDWFGGGPADVGIQTRAVLGRAHDSSHLKAVAAQYFRDYPRTSAGNGSLMRTAPVALANLGDDEGIAR
jgi:ADP-ribosylglycohydrolase